MLTKLELERDGVPSFEFPRVSSYSVYGCSVEASNSVGSIRSAYMRVTTEAFCSSQFEIPVNVTALINESCQFLMASSLRING